MPAGAKTKRILVIVPIDIEVGRGLLRGVRDYGRSHTTWVFQVVFPHVDIRPLARHCTADGVIAHLHSHALAAFVKKLRRPVVNVSNVIGDGLGLPRVGCDEAALAQTAAAHFLQRGFKNFGFFGYADFQHSRQREAGYRQVLRTAGFGCQSFAEPPGRHRQWGEPRWTVGETVRTWLLGLAKPVAVFTPSAERGFELLELCRESKLSVPHEVAVLAVDNDELICDLASPPLSAIRFPGERVGFEAATLLARLLQGRRAPRKPILVPPGEVVVRRSTDVLAVDDPALEKALRYIRENLPGPILVDEIARRAGSSRRALERRFRDVVGTSPLKEVRRLRIELAQRLLVETNLPMTVVAERCGFTTTQMLSDVFRQQTGSSPTGYRRKLTSH